MTGVQAGEPLSTPNSAEREQFIRSHYELIAGHATQLSASRWAYVQLSLFGVAAFYATLFSTQTRLAQAEVLGVLVCMPVAVAIFGLLQSWAIRRAIRQRNDVLLKIEEHYGFAGWAHKVNEKWEKVVTHPFDHLVYTYWATLCGFTGWFAYEVNTSGLPIQAQG